MNKNDILAAFYDPADEHCTQLDTLIPETFSKDRLNVAVQRQALGQVIRIKCGERCPHIGGQARHLKSIAMPALSSSVRKSLRRV
jgi:hypothetical protein